MELKFKDILGKYKGVPGIVALHGPSLTPHIDKIQTLQQEQGFKRISVNQWYDYFVTKPDAWIVSNTEYTIYNSIAPNFFWDEFNAWEKDVFNKHNVPLFYNCTADLTSDEFIQQNLKCDHLKYDTKHFKGHTCREVLMNFKEHFSQHKNHDFNFYGNNSEMWQPLSAKGTNCHPSWASFAGGWSRDNKCCHQISDQMTIQEQLQSYSGFNQHIGTGTSVGLFALVFAVLMEMNPIYIAGYDMDYSLGYANPAATGFKHRINHGAIGHWKKIHKKTIINDLTIIRESAKLLGIDIINTNKNSWFDTIKIDNLP